RRSTLMEGGSRRAVVRQRWGLRKRKLGDGVEGFIEAKVEVGTVGDDRRWCRRGLKMCR
ncbi:hypothetical protein U1Q18_048835, partial [Sarracenia purpurea var. burkii]